MKVNLSRLEKVLRLIIGTALFTLALCGGPSWAYVGVYLIFSGAWRFCFVYWIARNLYFGREPDSDEELKSKR